MNPSPENICVSYVSVNFYKISISYCGIIIYFFSLALNLVAQAHGMVSADVLCVPTLGDNELIFHATLGGEGVSTLGGSGYLAILAGDVSSTLGDAQGLFSRD